MCCQETVNHDKKMARDKLSALKDQLQELKVKTKGKGKIGKGKEKQGKENEAVKSVQAEIDAVNGQGGLE